MMKPIDPGNSLFRGNIYRSMDIAATGLTSQRMRIDAVASNIANISVTNVEGGGPYLRRQVRMETVPKQSFGDALKRVSLKMANTDSAHMGHTKSLGMKTEHIPLVKGSELEIPNEKKNLVYEPSHPDADDQGYVTYPDINVVEEMVDLMVASRAFDANVTVINAAKSMITKSLEI